MKSDIPGLDNEGRDVVDLDPDGLADAGGNKNLGAGGRVHSRTKVRALKVRTKMLKLTIDLNSTIIFSKRNCFNESL